MKQLWYCDECLKSGEVEFDDHAGVWEGYTAVSDAHHRASPDCPTRGADVHVPISPEYMPRWAQLERKNAPPNP